MPRCVGGAAAMEAAGGAAAERIDVLEAQGGGAAGSPTSAAGAPEVEEEEEAAAAAEVPRWPRRRRRRRRGGRECRGRGSISCRPTASSSRVMHMTCRVWTAGDLSDVANSLSLSIAAVDPATSGARASGSGCRCCSGLAGGRGPCRGRGPCFGSAAGGRRRGRGRRVVRRACRPCLTPAPRNEHPTEGNSGSRVRRVQAGSGLGGGRAKVRASGRWGPSWRRFGRRRSRLARARGAQLSPSLSAPAP